LLFIIYLFLLIQDASTHLKRETEQ
jgi:hypothetical protein